MTRDVWAAFRAELLKLRKRPATWVLLGLLLFSVVFFDYFIPFGVYLRVSAEVQAGVSVAAQVPLTLQLAALLPHQVIRAVMSTVIGNGSVIALVLGALMAGSEYGWGTSKTALASGPSRLALYAGQVSALAAALATLVPSVYLAAAAATFLVTRIEGGATTIPGATDWPALAQAPAALGVAYLLLAMPAAFGLLLATLVRATAPAIGFGLAWLFVVEGTIQTFAFASSTLGGILTVLPGANAGSLSTTFGVLGGSDATPVQGPVTGSAAHFSLVLVAYVVTFLSVGALVFRRRDMA